MVVVVPENFTSFLDAAEGEPLAAAAPEPFHVLNQFRNVLLAFATNPTVELTEQAEVMLDEAEDVMYDLQAMLLDQGRDHVVHVLDAPLVDVGGLVDVVDLAVQVAGGEKVLTS